MPKWSKTLDLSGPWKLCETKQITANELAGKISTRIWRSLTPYQDENIEGLRQELIETFKFASLNMRLTADSLDNLMEELYDWGDMNIGQDEKVCWVKTL